MPQKAKKSKCAYCPERATLTVTAPFATPVPCCDEHRWAGWEAGEKAVDMNQTVLFFMALGHVDISNTRYHAQRLRTRIDMNQTPNWRKPRDAKLTDHILGGGPRFAPKKG